MVALAQPAEQRIVVPQVMGSTPIGHPITCEVRESEQPSGHRARLFDVLDPVEEDAGRAIPVAA